MNYDSFFPIYLMQRVFPDLMMSCCSSKQSMEWSDVFKTDFILTFI